MLISDFTPELLFSLRNDWNNQIWILMQTSGDLGSNDFSGKYLRIEHLSEIPERYSHACTSDLNSNISLQIFLHANVHLGV